ncbi:hypothetical protein [Salinarchaeum chitinilyticum]
MSDSENSDRIDRMKEMEGGPSVDDVIEVYDDESGYSRSSQSFWDSSSDRNNISYSNSSD